MPPAARAAIAERRVRFAFAIGEADAEIAEAASNTAAGPYFSASVNSRPIRIRAEVIDPLAAGT
jgi:hypothetical protein